MKSIVLVIIMFAVSTVYGGTLKDKIYNDNNLIIPGFGADGVLLNDENLKVMQNFSYYKCKISSYKNKKEIFKDVLRIKCKYNIFFDKTIAYNKRKIIIFSYRRRVVAVIGLSNKRITSDSVNLSKGIEYFIFKYGNRGLVKMEKGRHKIYLYNKIGIALIDDNSDDSINMYIIFNSFK
ncbi:hypothetical protein ACFL20_01605 [Spirochaetota bacterium]